MTLSEYNRIYQVAHGVARDVGRAEKGCIFFNCFGAMILNKHYKIPARAVAGGFALCANDNPEVAFFGQINGRKVATSSDGFHVWVQTKTHIIDFMAPIYPEAFADATPKLSIPRKMFQREIATEAKFLDDLASEGDFFTLPDPGLTERLIDKFLGRAQNTDLLNVGDVWFGNRRKDQKKTFAMQDDLGKVLELSLPRTVAVGAW